SRPRWPREPSTRHEDVPAAALVNLRDDDLGTTPHQVGPNRWASHPIDGSRAAAPPPANGGFRTAPGGCPAPTLLSGEPSDRPRGRPGARSTVSMVGLVTSPLSRLARPAGALAMVAIDQRESLRGMFAEARGGAIPDETLVAFKQAVTETLAPLASAMLFDRIF